jgi:hypothetical protein
MVLSFMQVGAVLAFMAGAACAKEMAVDEVKAAELYDSGVVHAEIMRSKMVCN